MTENESFEPLEDRLAAEAQRMSAGLCSPAPVAELRAEFVRRRRRRAVTRSLFAVAAVVTVGFLAAGWNRRIDRDISRAGKEPRSGTPSPERAASPPGRPADEILAEGRAATAAAEQDPFVAIAILIPQTGDDGQQKFLPAWYVPGQLEEIDPRDLSPAERSAVSQLLGPDYEISDDQTI